MSKVLKSECCKEELKIKRDGDTEFIIAYCVKCGKEHRRITDSDFLGNIEKFLNALNEEQP